MNEKKSMSLQDIASAAFKNTIPYQATIELLTQCNLRCEHCYIPSHTCSGLPYEKVIDVLNQLRRLGTFELLLRSVYKELHADHETGTADNK